MTRKAFANPLLSALLLSSLTASAAEPDVLDPTPHREAAQVARDGTFLPYTLTPRIGDQRVATLALGGYDGGVGQTPALSLFIEGALFHRVALRVGIAYLNVKGGQIGPSVGLRFGLLRQEQQGIDMGLSVSYLNRGLPQPGGEPDGQIEVVLSLGRRVDRLSLYANLVYAQGLDPRERNAQIRLAALYALNDRVNVGLDARGHYELTNEQERDDENIRTDFDVVAGPLATLSFSHVMLMAQAGAHVEQVRGLSPHLAAGAIVTGGVGTSF